MSIQEYIQEASIVKFLLDKNNFNTYYKYIKELNLEKETKLIIDNINKYFETYLDKEVISIEELLLYYKLNNKTNKKDTLLEEFLKKVSNSNINTRLISENFNKILEKYFSSEIIYLIAEEQESNSSNYIDKVKDIINNFEEIKVTISTNSDKPFVSHTVSELLKKKNDTPGLNWGINCLDLHIGPLRGKTLGHVFARVDTGKTSFILNLIRNWIVQLQADEYVLYLNNEEDGEKLMIRLAQSVLNIDSKTIEEHAGAVDDMFKKRNGDKCLLHDSAIIYISDIEKFLKTHKIRAVVVDQADKLHFHGEKNVNDVMRLQLIYAKLRELSKKYAVDIITVGQASQSAENKKWLLPTDMDGSKTLKPGEFDYAIGIGRVFNDLNTEFDNVRYIHLCKNKMGTGQHAQAEVQIDTTKARYYDCMKGGGTLGEQLHSGHMSGSSRHAVSGSQAQEGVKTKNLSQIIGD